MRKDLIMKTKLMIVLALSLVMMSGSLFAQIEPPTEPVIIVGDTLMVFPTYNDTAFDAINKWIDYGFSLDTPVKVFRLARKETYKVSHTITTNQTLNIVAEKPDAENAPPLIVVATDLDNEFPGTLIQNYGDIIIKNIYFCGVDIEAQVIGEGAQIGYLIETTKDSTTNVVDGCYFEWYGADGASFLSGNNMINLTYTNNICMNNNSGGANWWNTWAGYVVNLGGNPAGKVVIRNNTSINNPGPFFINWHDLTDSLVIDHNTIINNAIMCLFNTTWTDAVISNNIFLNVGCEGIERQRLNAVDSLCWGVLNIDTLSTYNLDSSYAVKEGIERSEVESHRKISMLNNYCGWTSEIIDYWAVSPDTLRATEWMNTRIVEMFADDVNYPYLTEVGTYSMQEDGDPQFVGGYGGSATMDLLVGWMTNVLLRGGVEPTRYYYCPGEPGPQPNPAMVWPLQLDLRVGNTALVDTDGKPLGDLNWYAEYAERWDPDVLSTAVEAANALPVEFKLNQNFPNPFNPTTTIQYTLDKAGDVKMTVFNILGKKVKTLVNESQAPGTYNVKWDGINAIGQKMGSGIYFYKLETKNRSQINKMLLVK